VFVENKDEDIDIEKDVHIKLQKLYNKKYVNIKQKISIENAKPKYTVYGFKL
jgi:hypothetical protein